MTRNGLCGFQDFPRLTDHKFSYFDERAPVKRCGEGCSFHVRLEGSFERSSIYLFDREFREFSVAVSVSAYLPN